MEMENLIGKAVKVCPHSITVKGENGKTAGMVRGICRFKELRPSVQIEYWKKLKLSGVVSSGLLENVFFANGKLFYLHDLRKMQHYETIISKYPSDSTWEEERKSYRKLKSIAEEVGKFATVIPCYIQ